MQKVSEEEKPTACWGLLQCTYENRTKSKVLKSLSPDTPRPSQNTRATHTRASLPTMTSHKIYAHI